MICLTGDVHHHSYRGVDTWYSAFSEARLALRYSEIAARYGVKVTLFITGKTCRQEPALIAELSRMPNCEIGGHTYCAFRSPLHWIWKRLGSSFTSRFNALPGDADRDGDVDAVDQADIKSRFFTSTTNPNGANLGFGITGPAFFQARDIAKTVRAIEQLTGKRIRTWRNHAYRHDQHTYGLLSNAGIEVVSDHLSAMATAPERYSQLLLSLPLNTVPDHEHLLHGKYLPGRTDPERLASRVSLQDWLMTVQEKVAAIEDHEGIATVLAHPLCMDVADGMQSFEQLCRFLSRYQTGFVTETIKRSLG